MRTTPNGLIALVVMVGFTLGTPIYHMVQGNAHPLHLVAGAMLGGAVTAGLVVAREVALAVGRWWEA